MIMPYAGGDLTVKRRFRVIDAGSRLEKRQDPEPSITETTPAETLASSAPPESSTPQPTSTPQSTSIRPTTTSTPVETSSAAPTSTPVTSPSSTPVESSTPIQPSSISSTTPTTPTPTTPITSNTPTDPAQSSAIAPQSPISSISAISTQSIASTTNAAGAPTRVVTSFITNGAGGTVTVVFTSTSAAATASPSNSGSSANTGAIVGGVVGGVGGVLLLLALLWFIRRKTHKDKYEENMFAPDRNVDRNELDLAGEDVDDPEAIARPYHLPPSPTRNEMAMSTSSRPLSAQSHGPTLSGQHDDGRASYYTQPGSGMGMPMPMPITMPMPMSRDHIAHAHSRANSTWDHTEPTTSEGGSSSARLMKDREARRLHVANDDGGVIVHSDGGRVDEEASDEAPREIPPTYESISGPSGAR